MTAGTPRIDSEASAAGAREWRYDPWRESPGRAFAAAVCALGLCLLVGWLRPGVVTSAALCVFVAAAFAPAFVPVWCRADDAGVAVRGPLGWRRREWAELRRLDPLPAGALLSPYAQRHVLDAQRAIVLPLPATEREGLLARLREALARHGA